MALIGRRDHTGLVSIGQQGPGFPSDASQVRRSDAERESAVGVVERYRSALLKPLDTQRRYKVTRRVR